MCKLSNLVILAGTFLALSSAQARDTLHMLSYFDAVNSPEAKAKLSDDIVFDFGVKKHTNIATDFGEVATNKKTNAFNKSDEAACRWAFLSAIIALRDAARRQGANAVVDIRSNYKNHLIDDERQFECGAGGVIAGVALKGRLVTLKKDKEPAKENEKK